MTILLCCGTGAYASQNEFIQDLKMMWFGLYSRSNGKLDSSGFEHVFVGQSMHMIKCNRVRHPLCVMSSNAFLCDR